VNKLRLELDFRPGY